MYDTKNKYQKIIFQMYSMLPTIYVLRGSPWSHEQHAVGIQMNPIHIL